MRFNPQHATDNPGFSLLNPGIYPFKVIGAEDKTAGSGNDMIALKLQVGHGTVYDNLVGHEKMIWRIKHFFESAGIAAHFERGEVSAANCLNKTGIVKIGIEEGRNGKDRNCVVDYLTPETAEAAKDAPPERPKATKASMEVGADTIPF